MTEPQPAVRFTRVRRDINGRIKDKLTELGIAFEMEQQDDGRQLNTGEAADKYLPGGFAGNYGRA